MTNDAEHPKRRTQAERSESMRLRLIEATIICLDHEGFSGTTMKTIIETAGVSRGAPIHHFPTKAALLAATADHLIRKLYIHLGQIIAGMEASENRMSEMIMASWRELFSHRESLALMELLTASRRDPELAGLLKQLWEAGYEVLDTATRHYFEPGREGLNATHLFVLTHWLMAGMAAERHLTDSDAVTEHFLTLWCQILGNYLTPRPGITAPPPKPAGWRSH